MVKEVSLDQTHKQALLAVPLMIRVLHMPVAQMV
jgi:hypothetical protein